MAASLTLYCLEKLSDYLEFERLCHALLTLEGHPFLEPLGGFKDKGRDAVHRSNLDGKNTIFAYSVRSDWQVKLLEDAQKIYEHGHECDTLFFLSTGDISVSQRDRLVAHIQEEYGWRLEIRGKEWFKAILDGKHPSLKEQFPSIFPSKFLDFENQKTTEKKYVFLSFAAEHTVLASWITKRLLAQGYEIWSHILGLPESTSSFDDLEEVVRDKAFCFIGLYSKSSIADPNLNILKSLAMSISKRNQEDFLIPIGVTSEDAEIITAATSPLKPISFENWATGWAGLMQRLEKLACPKVLPDGIINASRIVHEETKLLNLENPDKVLSNCLKISHIPQTIYRFKVPKKITREKLDNAQHKWAYRFTNEGYILSFQQPPSDISKQFNIEDAGSSLWRENPFVNQIRSENLVSELLRKSLIVKCHEMGLVYCKATDLTYFPEGLIQSNKLKFIKPNGSKSYIKYFGEKTYWRPHNKSEKYQYHLAPNFFIQRNLFGQFSPVLTVRYRLADTNNVPLPPKKRNSRRKHLCKSWWNYEWLNRVLAVFYFLANGNEFISIGLCEKEKIVIHAEPLTFYSTISIDDAAVKESKKERAAIFESLHDNEIDEDDA